MNLERDELRLGILLTLNRKDRLMEHTKGKMEEVPDFVGLLQINGQTICCVSPVSCQSVEDLEKRKANAKHLVKCWNSHDDLLAACEMIIRVLDGDPITELNEKPITVIKRAIAAAQVEPD